MIDQHTAQTQGDKVGTAKMPLTQPKIVNEYIVWGNLRHWIGDLNETTIDCIREACEAVGESDDHEMLEAEIDERVDATDGAVAVYLSKKNWEAN